MSLETKLDTSDRVAPQAPVDISRHLLDSAQTSQPAATDGKQVAAAGSGAADKAAGAPPSYDTSKLYGPQAADPDRAMVEKVAHDKVEDGSKGLAVQKGEGYYQMLHRMHPDWSGKQTAQEAHRVKDLNGHNSHLKVGDVLQLYSPEQKASQVKGQMEAFDKATPGEKLEAIAEAAKPEIEKNLPSADKIAAAEKAAGITMSPADLHAGLVKHAQHDIENGSLKTSDLTKFPRVGGAFVASGAVSEAEMDKALAHQKELGAAAKDGAKPPRIGEVLADMYKDNPEKLSKIQAASKFYDELQKLTTEKK